MLFFIIGLLFVQKALTVMIFLYYCTLNCFIQGDSVALKVVLFNFKAGFKIVPMPRMAQTIIA